MQTYTVTPQLALEIYKSLVRCRKFEEKIVELYPEQQIKCPTHLSLGQEGVAAGVCAALTNGDKIFSTHRCHSHTVAKGANFKPLMAELYGKVTGCCRGKGGSMHFLAPEVGAMGASAIVAGSIPLAVGAALAAQMKGEKTVSVAFFGDGAVEQGPFHESLNFSALKKLPILFICENNGLATCTPISKRQAHGNISKRAEGYGLPGIKVDGNNVIEVWNAASGAAQRAKNGEGPTLIEALCYRWKEHVGPNYDHHLGFRTKEEVETNIKKCPIQRFLDTALEKNWFTLETAKKIEDAIQNELNAAVVFAKESPFPKEEEIFAGV